MSGTARLQLRFCFCMPIVDLMAMNYAPDNFYRQYSKVPDVSVTSSNPSVAQVDGDYIYFNEAGEATITVSCEAGSE